MKKVVAHVFIFVVVLFATGTSAVTYSLAKSAPQVNQMVAVAPPKPDPWYCSRATKNTSDIPKIFNQDLLFTLAHDCVHDTSLDIAALSSACAPLILQHDASEKSALCQKIVPQEIWNTSLTQNRCDAFASYLNDCLVAQKSGEACRTIDGYLVPADVPLTEVNRIAHEAALYCSALFPTVKK